MIVRGTPAWTNELPDKYSGLFDDEAPAEEACAEAAPQQGIPEEHLELLARDNFHRDLFAKLSDSEIRSARKLCPFYRILRLFRREPKAEGAE